MSEINHPEQTPIPANKLTRLRLVMALLVGVGTAAAGCIEGFYSLREPFSWVCTGQQFTVILGMWNLSDYLNEYKEQHGTFPLILEEMTSQWKGHDGETLDKQEVDRRIRDAWRNPMVYSSDGQTWELLSYGADGKPGGIGLDADIRCTDADVSENENPFKLLKKLTKHATPTFAQVLLSGHFDSPVVFSLLAGFICSLFVLYPVSRCRTRRGIIISTIALMIMSSYVVANLIAALSFANGH
jgi:general secretion pathway protein G